MYKLPLVDHGIYDRALRMASAARPSAGPGAAAGRLGVPHASESQRAGGVADTEKPLWEQEPTHGDRRLSDRFGRAITYLRLSVTDRCNLRCEYCTPVTSGDFLPRDHLLSDDEIVEVLQTMARSGLEKVRFTGGEPLVRPGFLELVERVRGIEGLRELCLSTNGLLLADRADRLVAAGVTRFNVSVDTLDPDRFRAVTRGGDLGEVWRGVERVLAIARSRPALHIRLKINAVLMKGLNEGEIERFAELTRGRPLHVRFIELMPLAHCGAVHDERYVPSTVVLDALERMGGVRPVERTRTDGPALMYAFEGAPGSIGVISPVSETHFCDRCNRVRLGADGRLKLCLFGDEVVDLRAVLRARPRADGDLDAALAQAMDLKPEKMAGFAGFTMMSIGG